MLLSVVGDVRDDRGELFDLEAQGASPATIRAHLRLRALLVAAFGVVGGLALGAILTSLVIALVSVTAAHVGRTREELVGALSAVEAGPREHRLRGGLGSGFCHALGLRAAWDMLKTRFG